MRITSLVQRYRLLLVIFGIGTLAGAREYAVTRREGSAGGPVGCEASAASCFAIRSSALATRDPDFWRRHSAMVKVVAELNPDDPDTEFLKGMEALAAGNKKEFERRFGQAVATEVKHNYLLLQYYAQYLLDSGADWQRVNDAVNRWRENHQLSSETLTMNLAAGPRTPSDDEALRDALSRVDWIRDARLERSTTDSTEQWLLRMGFRPGRTVDMREAVAAVTTLSIPEDQRPFFDVTCRTLVDCTATRIKAR